MFAVFWLFSNNSQLSASITASEQPTCWLFRRLSASQLCNAIQAEKEQGRASGVSVRSRSAGLRRRVESRRAGIGTTIAWR
jgi:hypothetical protein